MKVSFVAHQSVEPADDQRLIPRKTKSRAARINAYHRANTNSQKMRTNTLLLTFFLSSHALIIMSSLSFFSKEAHFIKVDNCRTLMKRGNYLKQTQALAKTHLFL
jgi:hypothetical protein